MQKQHLPSSQPPCPLIPLGTCVSPCTLTEEASWQGRGRDDSAATISDVRGCFWPVDFYPSPSSPHGQVPCVDFLSSAWTLLPAPYSGLQFSYTEGCFIYIRCSFNLSINYLCRQKYKIFKASKEKP
jgi:hypothetical protein